MRFFNVSAPDAASRVETPALDALNARRGQLQELVYETQKAQRALYAQYGDLILKQQPDKSLEERDIEQRRLARIRRLAGDDSCQLPSDKTRYEQMPGSAGQYWSLIEQEKDLAAAIEILDRKISDEKERASAAVCAQMHDHHRDLVRAMARAMADLHVELLAYWRFAEAMNRKGLNWGALRAAYPHFCGSPEKLPGAEIRRWFAALVADGHITKDEVPEALR